MSTNTSTVIPISVGPISTTRRTTYFVIHRSGGRRSASHRLVPRNRPTRAHGRDVSLLAAASPRPSSDSRAPGGEAPAPRRPEARIGGGIGGVFRHPPGCHLSSQACFSPHPRYV